MKQALTRWAPLLALATLLVGLAACQPENLFTPPRLATQTASPPTPPGAPAAVTPLEVGDPTPAVTPEPGPTVANPSITLWIDETSAAHRALLADMIRAFQEDHAIQVELVQVAPALLPDLMATAVLSGTLPDLVLHPIDYTFGWHERGILDAEAATALLRDLGPETFSPETLAWLAVPGAPDEIVALPSDGWRQLLVYRTDWFAERGLAPPVDFGAIISGTQGMHDPANLVAGLVVPTEDALLSTQRVFEHFALANGCQLIDARGEITFFHPACLDALDYYRELVNRFSPSDVQTDTSALNAYLEGRTGLIVASPAVLPAIAGLVPDNRPRCPACADPGYLIERSGLVTAVSGRGPFAGTARYGQLGVLGITRAAAREPALAFARFWFGAGYLRWLSLEPERKAPARQGDASDPTRYIAAWRDLPLAPGGPTLEALVGPDVAADLAAGSAGTERWGLPQGQGAVVSRIAEAGVFPILLQEMLSGYITTSRTVLDATNRVIALIPDYGFEPPPTATPPAE